MKIKLYFRQKYVSALHQTLFRKQSNQPHLSHNESPRLIKVNNSWWNVFINFSETGTIKKVWWWFRFEVIRIRLGLGKDQPAGMSHICLTEFNEFKNKQRVYEINRFLRVSWTVHFRLSLVVKLINYWWILRLCKKIHSEEAKENSLVHYTQQ